MIENGAEKMIIVFAFCFFQNQIDFFLAPFFFPCLPLECAHDGKRISVNPN